MHVGGGGFPRGSGPPGAFGGSRDLEGPPKPPSSKNAVLNEKCARRVPAKPRTLGEAEISRGMVGLD